MRTAAAAVAIGLDPYVNVAVVNDTYTNGRLRLSFRRPRNWEYSSIADFAALRQRTVLQSTADEILELFSGDLPVVLVEDPINRDGYFAPAIALYDEQNLEPYPKNTVRAHREFIVDVLAAVYRNVRLLASPKHLDVNGVKGTLSTSSYTHEMTDGAKRDLLLRTVIVPRGERTHTFYFVDCLHAPKTNESTWNEVIASIKYEP